MSVVFSGELNDKMKGFYRSKYTGSDGEDRYAAVTQFEVNKESVKSDGNPFENRHQSEDRYSAVTMFAVNRESVITHLNPLVN